jgi:hypothetical protein
MRVSVESVPRETWRRVARHLESVRGSLDQDADDAYLGDEVCPIYRPDIECVAYWEFEVHGLPPTAAREQGKKSSGTGFILATAGRHDVPIPHWSLAMEPPTRALEARSGGKPIHRMIKLDALTYAAEAHDGGLITHVGQMPLRIEDVRPEHRTEIASASTVRAADSDDDGKPPAHRRKRSESPPPRLAAWTSWKALRRGYAREYRPQLAALAERAAAAWDIEDLVAEHGEGIHEGESLVIPLLRPGKIAVAGKGARCVTAIQRECGKPAIVVKVGDVPAGSAEIPFEIVIRYEQLEPETLEFFVVPKDAPSNQRTTLPHHATHRGGRP